MADWQDNLITDPRGLLGPMRRRKDDHEIALLRRAAAVTGRDLRNARPGIDENGQPAVTFTLNPDGARRFGQVTGDNIGRQLAIVLDGRVQSAPTIESQINNEGQITGSFTTEEVQNLSLVLKSGALPASLT